MTKKELTEVFKELRSELLLQKDLAYDPWSGGVMEQAQAETIGAVVDAVDQVIETLEGGG